MQFDQRQFDFFVATIAALFPWLDAKDTLDVICIATHYIQQRSLFCCLEVCNASFYEVPGAIEFMSIAQIFPAPLRFYDSKVWIQVAISLLGRGNEGNYLIHHCFECGVRMCCQTITGGFEPLSHIGIPELMRHVFHARFPVKLVGSQATRFLKFIVDMRYAAFAVDLQTW